MADFEDDLSLTRKIDENSAKSISQEYYDVVGKYIDQTFYSFLKPENDRKNRYVDIPCWDHSRVVIRSENGEEDYIHANWIDGFNEEKKFIATQGPTKNTVADFWRMVWQQNARVIVMLTKTVVNNQEKCCQYWCPRENYQVITKNYKIQTLKVTIKPNYIITFLSITDIGSKRSRNVTHFQYTQWSEFGTPNIEYFVHFIKMVNRVRNAYMAILLEPKQVFISPVIVHCSTGVGRTGTFCAVDIILNQLVKTSEVSIPEVVLNVRKQRYFAIMSLKQYVFTYKVLLYILSVVQNSYNKPYDTCPICL